MLYNPIAILWECARLRAHSFILKRCTKRREQGSNDDDKNSADSGVKRGVMNPLELLRQPAFADVKTIGIPRGLLYYRYATLWRTFFEELGRRVVVSDPTDRAILEAGDHVSVDECCLASKIYMGQVDALLHNDEVDALFIPSVDNLGHNVGFCTKFQALPDLVSNTFITGTHNPTDAFTAQPVIARVEDQGAQSGKPDQPEQPEQPGQPHRQALRILSAEIDVDDSKISEPEAFLNLGQQLGATKKEAKAAYKAAVKAQAKENKIMHAALKNTLEEIEKLPADERPLKILLVAHPYVLHDAYIGEPIKEMLEEYGAVALCADQYDRERALKVSDEFSDTMPWVVNRELIGAILSLYDQIDGIVLMSAFPCGPDSMTNDAIVRFIKGKPILSITVDAQSGLAGLETRVESFVDILGYQRKGGYIHE